MLHVLVALPSLGLHKGARIHSMLGVKGARSMVLSMLSAKAYKADSGQVTVRKTSF